MTKFLWAAVITIVSSIAFSNPPAIAQFIDDFSDGDFTSNPAWAGNDSEFSISSEQLKLNAPAATGSTFLSTQSSAIINASWEFSIRLEFNPSGSNYARVYLVSDHEDLSVPLNGYYVLIGNTSDEVSLYLQTGQTHKKIIDGGDGRVDQSLVEIGIKVTRDENGNWELFSDVGPGDSYTSEGMALDMTHSSSNYFGVFCTYTSTRSDKFFFDDFKISGQPFVDNTVYALYKEVIITEILADPSPAVGLPDVEFIEIFNKTSNEFNLNNWTLSDGASTASITNKILPPGEYLLVVPFSSIDRFSFLQNVIGVSSFPSLNNGGDHVILKSQTGITIDSIMYSDTWYRDTRKKEGGWSLEIIDPSNPCGEEDNWTASENDEGGTPGKQNSVFANKPDLHGPKLVQVIAHSTAEIELKFDENLAKDDIPVSAIVFNPQLQIQSVDFSDESLRSLIITLNSTMQHRQLYSVTVNAVRDCNLNVINENNKPFFFAMPEEADSLDVVINEILFNPWPTGVDFIELFNASPKFINLKNLNLANWDEDGMVNSIPLSGQDILIRPDDYFVLTMEPNTIIGQYPKSAESNFLQTTLPSLPDDTGSLALINEQGKIIDAFAYSKELHSPLLNDEEGVSLERISPIVSSEDPQNWKSASSGAGYATPGFLNSNSQTANTIGTTSVKVDPEIFQPIIGTPNFTRIWYKFDQGGSVANIKIYDGRGRMVKHIANNEILGSEGFYRWDGDQDDGAKARTGYYFVWFEVFDLTGTVRTFRNRVVIAGQY